jgi:hypothetical protein
VSHSYDESLVVTLAPLVFIPVSKRAVCISYGGVLRHTSSNFPLMQYDIGIGEVILLLIRQDVTTHGFFWGDLIKGTGKLDIFGNL